MDQEKGFDMQENELPVCALVDPQDPDNAQTTRENLIIIEA